jgi:L,D-transpeptidase YcbB
MRSVRRSVLTGTALVSILAAPAFANTGVRNSSDAPEPAASMPAPAERDYSLPGSTPKPSALMPSDHGLRFRGTLPATDPSRDFRQEPATPPAATVTPSEPQDGVEPPPAPARPAAISPPPVPPPAPPAASRPAPAPATAAPSESPRVIEPTPAPVRPAATSPPAAPQAVTRPVPPPPVQAEPPVQPAPRMTTRPVPSAPATVTRPAAPSPAPAAVASPAADDSAVADKLRELIAGKRFEQLVQRKPDRDAIAAFYQKSREFRPLWASGGGPSERAKDVIDHLKTVEADGLDPRDYPVPSFAAANPAAQAEAEIKFTETALTYARHAMNGRVHFSRLSPSIEYKLAFDADEVLKKIAASDNLLRTFASFNPQQPAYKALRAKLAELRETPAAEAPRRFESGPVLRYARDRNGRESVMADARVPKLRERFGLAAEPNHNYNQALAMAVAKYQKASGLQPTGQLNGATIDALNGPNRAKQVDAVLATMERWRWVPRDLGRTHIMLNIPDFHLRVYNEGQKVWQTRVVVGKPTQQTPLLTETMKYITVNPTWNVPQSIIYNELLPIYETSDPQIFARQGLTVERNRDGSIRVFQPPGERNALGQIRFNFPNKFLVYQHDTPEKHYFAQEKRAYSHGCMRVQDPLKYAEVLMSYANPRANVTQARIRQMFGGEEKQLDFVNHLPVHITYQTAFVDEQGKLQLRDDVYGLDAKLMSILRGERAVADVPIERPADPNFKPTPEATQRLHNVARGGHSPFALFDKLFR